MSVSSNVLRRSRDPQYLHLYSKTLRNYRQCSEDFLDYRYSESILNAFEVLEFFWKSISFLNSGSYPQRHLPRYSDFRTISTLLRNFLSSTQISQIQNIFSSYNPRWRPNPVQRMQPRYGDERAGIPPSQLYNYNEARKAVKYCENLTRTLSQIHRNIVINHPKSKIAILNGKVSTSSSEKRCTQHPHANRYNVRNWFDKINKIPNVIVNRLPISKIDSSFSIVINPFGESYPEKPNSQKMTPAFDVLCDYIFDGGIFVTMGGLPFTYYWDVMSGNQHNANTIVPNYPTNLVWSFISGRPQIQMRTTTLLLNNLLEKTFNVMTTMDDPTSGQVGPVSLRIFQNREDKKYWDCTYVGPFHEFRSIDPQRSPSAIPIARALRYGTEVWPIAIVRYGFGLLFHVGLDLNLSNVNEYDFTLSALEGLVTNYISYFS